MGEISNFDDAFLLASELASIALERSISVDKVEFPDVSGDIRSFVNQIALDEIRRIDVREWGDQLEPNSKGLERIKGDLDRIKQLVSSGKVRDDGAGWDLLVRASTLDWGEVSDRLNKSHPEYPDVRGIDLAQRMLSGGMLFGVDEEDRLLFKTRTSFPMRLAAKGVCKRVTFKELIDRYVKGQAYSFFPGTKSIFNSYKDAVEVLTERPFISNLSGLNWTEVYLGDLPPDLGQINAFFAFPNDNDSRVIIAFNETDVSNLGVSIMFKL